MSNYRFFLGGGGITDSVGCQGEDQSTEFKIGFQIKAYADIMNFATYDYEAILVKIHRFLVSVYIVVAFLDKQNTAVSFTQ